MAVPNWRCVAFFFLASAFSSALSAQPTLQLPSASTTQKIAERDQLFADAQQLEDEGRLEDAVVLLLQVEAIEDELGLEYDRSGALRYLAEIYERLGDFEEARRRLKTSREILEQLVERGEVPEAPWRLVDAKWQQRDLEIRQTLEPEELAGLVEAKALGSKIFEFWHAGRYQEALPMARQALELQRSAYGREHPTIARRLHDLGLLYRRSGDYYAAQTAWTETLDLRRKTLGQAHPLYGESLFNLAEISRLMGRYEEAEALLREAYAVLAATRPEGHLDPMRAIVALGVLLREKGDLFGAEELLLKVQKRAPPGGELSRQILSALANVKHDLDDWEGSKALMEHLDEAIRQALGEDSPKYSNVLQNHATLKSTMAEYAEAEDYFERAAQVLSRVPAEPLELATLRSNWALLRYRMGDPVTALRLLNEALSEFDEALPKNHPQRALMLQNLALVKNSLGDIGGAGSALLEALAISEDRLGTGSRAHTAILINLGTHFQNSGDLQQARPLLIRAINQAQPGSQLWASARISLAGIELATNSFDATALQSLEAAFHSLGEIAQPTHPDYCYALTNLAAAQLAMGELLKTKATFRRSLDCLRSSLDLAATVQSERQQLAMLGKARQILDVFLSLSGGLFLSSEEIYATVLLWKGIVLARRLRPEEGEPDDELVELFRQLQFVSSRLAAFAHRPSSAKQQEELTRLVRLRETLQRNVARRSVSYRQQERFRTIGPQQVLDALPTDAVLIDLVEYEYRWLAGSATLGPRPKGKGLMAFVLRPGEPIQRVDLGRSEAILALIKTWRSGHGLDRGERPGAMAESGVRRARIGLELRRRLWDPLARVAGDVPMILWSPDGATALFPMGALPGDGNVGFLLQQRVFVWIPAAQMLVIRKDEGRLHSVDVESLPRLLAVGGVDFDSRFADLPASGEEVEEIARLFNDKFPQGSASSLTKKEASESAFRRLVAGRRFVHLATHGFFATSEMGTARIPSDSGGASSQQLSSSLGWVPGLQSWIVFARAEVFPETESEEDGILTALELETLDLSATEMLVLSACESGLGVNVAGEGLLGLLRAAQVAGTLSVVASLWNVPDRETGSLMKRFYQNLWGRKMSRVEALRSAQLEVLRTNPNPSAWAGWILAGDWW